MLTKLLCILAVVLLVQAYDISASCRTEGCPPGCFQCATYQGGPFNKNSVCIDPNTCDPNAPSTVYSINCDGCSSGVCSYSITAGQQGRSGCTDIIRDRTWASLLPSLNFTYHYFFPRNPPYDWCGNSCTRISTGALVGLIAGGVILVAIGIVVAVKFYKTKKAENYQKM